MKGFDELEECRKENQVRGRREKREEKIRDGKKRNRRLCKGKVRNMRR